MVRFAVRRVWWEMEVQASVPYGVVSNCKRAAPSASGPSECWQDDLEDKEDGTSR
jgi:hypothetical protein